MLFEKCIKGSVGNVTFASLHGAPFGVTMLSSAARAVRSVKPRASRVSMPSMRRMTAKRSYSSFDRMFWIHIAIFKALRAFFSS